MARPGLEAVHASIAASRRDAPAEPRRGSTASPIAQIWKGRGLTMGRVTDHLRTLRNLTRSRIRLQELSDKVAITAAANAEDRTEIGTLRHKVENLEAKLVDQERTIAGISQTLETTLGQIAREMARLNSVIDAQRRSYVEITRQLAAPSTTKSPQQGENAAKDPFLDIFYREFEDRYRGSREEILVRLREYSSHLVFLKDRDRRELRIVDLGCGRGEWLEVLRDEGLPATGVDNNEAQAEAARQLGLDIEIDDAIVWLGAQKDRSIDLLSAFHLVEHLEFPVLVNLLKEALRVLKPGGGLLIETPNPESLIVGAYKFWFDPTHVRPYPPELLSQLLETLTFQDIKVLRLHPDGRNQEYKLYGLPAPVADLVAGALDYAIFCRRP